MKMKSPGRKREYRKPVMKLLIKNPSFSINEIIDKLPLTDKKCLSCDGTGFIFKKQCLKCKISPQGGESKKKVDYNSIFREIKSLEKEKLVDKIELLEHIKGKPTIKYAITTEGAKWCIDNNQFASITKFIDMLLLRSNTTNNSKFVHKEYRYEKTLLLEKLERKHGFEIEEIIKHYENQILKISRKFVSPLKTQENFAKLKYLSKTDLKFLKTVQPILNVLNKNGLLTFDMIFEKVKSDYKKNQFEKTFEEIASKGMIYIIYKNDHYFYCLSHVGFILYLYGIEVKGNNFKLNSIKTTGELLFPSFFQRGILQKLEKAIDSQTLLFSIFLHHCYPDSLFFHPINKSSKRMFWLANTQEQLLKTYFSTYFDLYFSILQALDSSIKKKYPDFEIIDKSNPIQPRILRYFRDLLNYGYNTGRDSDKLEHKEILKIIEKRVVDDKINSEHLKFIIEKYDQILLELWSLDRLIYGDDIDNSPFIIPITEFGSRFEKNGEMIEFKSWLFLKDAFPEISEKIIDDHKDLKNWLLIWENEIKKFSVQNNPFNPRQI